MSSAGPVLYSAAANCARTGDADRFDEVVDFVRERYSASGREKHFQEDLAAPIKRRGSCVLGSSLVTPGTNLITTHAFSRCASAITIVYSFTDMQAFTSIIYASVWMHEIVLLPTSIA